MGGNAGVPFVDNAAPASGQGPTFANSDAASGSDSWAAAAQPVGQPAASQPAATPGQPPAPGGSPAMPKVNPSDASSNATVPMQPAPPLVLKTKQSPISRAVDATLNALTGGGQKPEIATDANGNEYVKTTSMSHGEQWVRIGLEALHGAAEGLAAGRGAGNLGKAAAAGWDAGAGDVGKQQQATKDLTAQARQQNLDNANYQMLQMNKAEQAWKMTRMQVEATQHDVDFANGQIDRLVKTEGGTIIGNAAHSADIAGILKVNPNVMEDMIKKHQIEIVPHYDANGKPAGITAIKMPDGYRSTVLPQGAIFHTFDQTTGQFVEHHASDPMTAGQRDDYESAAAAASLKWQNDKHEQELKAAQTDKAKADAEKDRADAANAPSVASRDAAEAAQARAGAVRNYAEAAKDTASAQQIKSGQANPDGTPNPKFEALAQALYDGDITTTDLKREAKGEGLNPNDVVARAVEIGQQTGKPWSESIIKQEQKFAEAPKTQAALDGIDRIIGSPDKPETGYMAQMLNLADKADLGTNGAFNGSRLAVQRFFGNTAAKNFNTAVSETRRSIAALIGNPLLGGSETDKKLEQADDMLGEHPTMENLRGAAAILTRALQTQRGSIIENNRFLQRRYSQGLPPTAKASPPPASAPDAQTLRAQAAAAGVPANAIAIAHDAQGRVVGYQDATGYHALGAK